MLSRRRLSICGQVQGVGFRPFVYRLAAQLQLTGWVANSSHGVLLEIQGDGLTVEHFCKRLVSESPPLTLIEQIEQTEQAVQTETGFRIVPSKSEGNAEQSIRSEVTPDLALCQDCLSELFTPTDRRYRHPFISCTTCGPRFSIIQALPYDRPHTTMSEFVLCPACAEEYADPACRRFHAQPIACWHCGPTLSWHNAMGIEEDVTDPVMMAVKRLQQGDIIAVKGIGGIHLLCDACNPSAVERLRLRKGRPDKPFAIMATNVESLEQLVACSAERADLLRSPSAPILLLPKTKHGAQALAGVAPKLSALGVMLPYTPLHYLLFHAAAGYPEGLAWLQQPQSALWVVTSANLNGEPLISDNDDALTQLQGLADGYLLHDRVIHVRCDDSVIQGSAGGSTLMRRARGLAPQAIKLAEPGATVLATGGLLKNTVCLTQGQHAYVSPYLGDLHSAASCRWFEQTIAHLRELFAIGSLQLIACDLHPDFYSSRYAEALAAQTGCPLLKVQHHHAHIAAVMAEHQLTGPVLGLALDGFGLGTDGTLWGGELLTVEGADFQRLGYLKPLALPGGDRAAREPWRMAAGVLHELGRGAEIEARFSALAGASVVHQMLNKQFNVSYTSSAGRLFDAAAGLLGLQLVSSFEGQAAMQLESLLNVSSLSGRQTEHLTQYYQLSADGILDFYPLLSRLADESDPARGATLFHAVLVTGMGAWVDWAVATTGVKQIVFAGGCFANRYLRTQLSNELTTRGLAVFNAQRLPCNDSGLSLGQAWVARQLFR